MIEIRKRQGDQGLTAMALASTFGLFAIYQVAATLRAGGFEYPLDDVYIHLAMAEQIARGGYGINPGEVASASSSILYPLLLTPFAGTELQRYLPIAWNAVAMIGCGLVWAAILRRATVPEATRWLAPLALLVPIGANIAIAGYTGMEHGLHLVTVLLIVLGLVVFAQQGRIRWYLVLAIFLSPALRYEGLAPSVMAAAVIFLSRRPMAGLALAALATVPILLQAGALTHMGLNALPNSVLSKAGGEVDMIARLAGLVGNLPIWPNWFLLLAAPAGLGIALRCETAQLRLIGLTAVLILLAQLAVSKGGWLGRYEAYALVFAFAVGSYLLLQRPERLMPLWLVLLAVPAIVYQMGWIDRGQFAPRASHLQQAQMARLARDHGGAVAVNDIGRVAWGNPSHVLDLWGLASSPLMAARLRATSAGWADGFLRARDVELAMVYDSWFAQAPSADWRHLAVLRFDGPAGLLGGRDVSIYAVGAADDAALTARLQRFATTLPAGARLDFPNDEGTNR